MVYRVLRFLFIGLYLLGTLEVAIALRLKKRGIKYNSRTSACDGINAATASNVINGDYVFGGIGGTAMGYVMSTAAYYASMKIDSLKVKVKNWRLEANGNSSCGFMCDIEFSFVDLDKRKPDGKRIHLDTRGVVKTGLEAFEESPGSRIFLEADEEEKTFDRLNATGRTTPFAFIADAAGTRPQVDDAANLQFAGPPSFDFAMRDMKVFRVEGFFATPDTHRVPHMKVLSLGVLFQDAQKNLKNFLPLHFVHAGAETIAAAKEMASDSEQQLVKASTVELRRNMAAEFCRYLGQKIASGCDSMNFRRRPKQALAVLPQKPLVANVMGTYDLLGVWGSTSMITIVSDFRYIDGAKFRMTVTVNMDVFWVLGGQYTSGDIEMYGELVEEKGKFKIEATPAPYDVEPEYFRIEYVRGTLDLESHMQTMKVKIAWNGGVFSYLDEATLQYTSGTCS